VIPSMSDEPLPQQNEVDRILTELDLQRKDLERRDQELVEEAVKQLVAVGLSDKRARQVVRAQGGFKIVAP